MAVYEVALLVKWIVFSFERVFGDIERLDGIIMLDSRALGKALSRIPSKCWESAAGLINTSSQRRLEAGFISTRS